MTIGALIWIIIFLLSAATFFTLASIIGFLGFKDLRELLRQTDRGDTTT